MPHQRDRNARASASSNIEDGTQRFAIRFSFDGTTYQGFQSQPYQNTIQDQLEHRLRGLLKRHVRIIAWGRTDTGVHAQGAVATVDLTKDEVERFAKMAGKDYLDETISNETKAARFLFSVLKEFACNTGFTGNPQVRYGSISSKAVVAVPLDFDARYSALWKRYVYYICSGSFYDQSPFVWSRYAWRVREELDLAAMREAANLLSDKQHNFSWMSVTQAGELRDPRRSVKLTVEEVPVQLENDDTLPYFLRAQNTNIYKISGSCDFFLYKMMRRIVGILVAVGQGKGDVATLTKCVDAFDKDEKCKEKIPHAFLETAPAKGLCLEHIEYSIPI